MVLGQQKLFPLVQTLISPLTLTVQLGTSCDENMHPAMGSDPRTSW